MGWKWKSPLKRVINAAQYNEELTVLDSNKI